jgi:hypothetical protein
MSRTVPPRYHAVDIAFSPSLVAALGATGIAKANDFRLSTMWIGLGWFGAKLEDLPPRQISPAFSLFLSRYP